MKHEHGWLNSDTLILLSSLIIIWFIFLGFVFKLFQIAKIGNTLETSIRIVSTTHSISITLFGMIDTFWKFSDINKPNTDYHNNVILFCCSFFIYETILFLFIIRPFAFDAILHHLFALSGIAVCFPNYGGVTFL